MGEADDAPRSIADRVALNLRLERARRNLTLRDIAEETAAAGHPMPVSVLSKIENRDRRVDVDDLVALAWVLRMPPHELLFGTAGPHDLVAVTPTTTLTAADLYRWFSARPLNTSGAAMTELIREIVKEALNEATGPGLNE